MCLLRKFIFLTLCSSISLFSHAQNHEVCYGEDSSKWDSCYGTLKFSSGDSYVGGFKSGKFSGYGIFNDSRGGGYIGEWLSNVPHGQGRAHFGDGRPNAQGRWESGKLVQPHFGFDPLIVQNHIERVLQTRSTESQAAETTSKKTSDSQKDKAIAEAALNKTDSRPRIALLIGNAKYSSAPLANPVNDVRGMSSALKRAGFQVLRYENLDYKQMRNAVRDFGEKLSNDHVGFFYYSGHGVQVNGKNYLIPVNSDIKYEDEVASSALDVDMVLAKLESARNELNIVVLDACRDSPLGRRTRTATKGLSNISAARGTLIAFSTAPGQVALDGTEENSPYTKHLIKAIQKEGLLLELVFKEVRANVVRETEGKQVPWENSSVLGDFFFLNEKEITK